jgi:predicted transcriptional regulator
MVLEDTIGYNTFYNWFTREMFHQHLGGGYDMTIHDVVKILDGKFIVGEKWKDKVVHTACGSDMMSDVLAFMKAQTVLLTGLCNLQVIRTADMVDVICIVFVRGRMPDKAMIELAREKGIALISTGYRMFSACGVLYENGLQGGEDDG